MPSLPPDRLLYVRQLRARTARPVGAGVAHGDLCPKLTLQGVDFAIPPRGVQLRPRFEQGRASVCVTRPDDDTDADARRLPALAPVRSQPCPHCGLAVGGRVEIDPGRADGFLALCFDLAARLLRRQYDLDDQQLADLLSFSPDQPPVWIAQLLAWAGGT